MNCIRELIESGAKSSPAGKDTDNNSLTNLLPACTNESITSLLGGAFKVILDCRFAMTQAVVGNHGAEMSTLPLQVIIHLQQLSRKILRV